MILKKLQTGAKITLPQVNVNSNRGYISVEDTSDPRYQAYQDSLYMYNLAPSTGSNPIPKSQGDDYRKMANEYLHWAPGQAQKAVNMYLGKAMTLNDALPRTKRSVGRNSYEEVQTSLDHLLGGPYQSRKRQSNELDWAQSNHTLSTEGIQGDRLEASVVPTKRYFHKTISPVGWEDQPVYKKPTMPVVVRHAPSQRVIPRDYYTNLSTTPSTSLAVRSKPQPRIRAHNIDSPTSTWSNSYKNSTRNLD